MATTDNAVYFCGYLPDHFTEWNGVGSPTYTAVVKPSAWSGWNTPWEITLTSTLATLSNGLYGCLWGNFVDPTSGASITLNTFWTSVVAWINSAANETAAALTNYCPVVYHCAAGFLLIKQAPGVSNTLKLYLTPSITDSTQYIDLGLSFNPSTTTPNILTLNVNGAGTTTGSISFYNNNILIGTWSGDLTSYSDFGAVSFHRLYGSSTTNYMAFFYCLTTNFSLLNNYLDVQTISGIGTDTDWGTNTTSFATMPTNYADFSDGLYGDTVGDKMTLTYASTPAAVGYEPKAVCISHGIVTGTAGGDIEVQGMVKNPTTGVETTLGTHSVSTTGAQDTFSMTVNPATGEKWTLAEVNSTEFGLIRAK